MQPITGNKSQWTLTQYVYDSQRVLEYWSEYLNYNSPRSLFLSHLTFYVTEHSYGFKEKS